MGDGGMSRLGEWFVNKLIERAKRTPYEHIGDYMGRWWLIPYRYKVLGLVPIGIAARIHHIRRSDDDRAFHDHPWWSLSVVLRGGYYDVTPAYDKSGLLTGVKKRWYGPGSVILRRAKQYHRLEIPEWGSAWTLFITGPKVQSWGFQTTPQPKVYWKDYLSESKGESAK